MKDRVALKILDQAISNGIVTASTVIVESSSGNLGIGLAQACRLVLVAIAVAMTALLLSEWVSRAVARRISGQ